MDSADEEVTEYTHRGAKVVPVVMGDTDDDDCSFVHRIANENKNLSRAGGKGSVAGRRAVFGDVSNAAQEDEEEEEEVLKRHKKKTTRRIALVDDDEERQGPEKPHAAVAIEEVGEEPEPLEDPRVAALAQSFASMNVRRSSTIEAENDPAISVEDENRMKAKYSMYIKKAKDFEDDGDLKMAIKYFNKAKKYADFDEMLKEKVGKKIKKLQKKIESENEEDIIVIAEDLKLPIDEYELLFPHQKEGLEFLFRMHKSIGGILADDMGMGKTIQVAVFFRALYFSSLLRKRDSHVSLIVAPVSLLENWMKELEKWTHEVSTLNIHDITKKHRSTALDSFKSSGGGIVMASYGLITAEPDLFYRFSWQYLVLDEGHKIKNSASQGFKAINEVSSVHRLVLSGTPIQNNLKELWTLFHFACQGKLLGDRKQFLEEFEKPILAGRAKRASQYARYFGEKATENLRDRIEPYMLRREKSIFVDDEEMKSALNVEKNDMVIWLSLTDVQKNAYEGYVQEQLEGFDAARALLTLNVLKKICDHPALFTKEEDSDGFDYLLVSDQSVKMRYVKRLIPELIAGDHRCLFFSMSKFILNMMQEILASLGLKYLRIDGSVNANERDALVQKFNTNQDIHFMLLTSQVGGVGLNLVGADRVIIYDMSWNPAVENQAVDRSYRIGQIRNVVIYRLLCCGTIEERIYEKQVSKGSLIQSAFNKKNQFRYFTERELQKILNLGDTRTSVIMKELNDLHPPVISYEELKKHISAILKFEEVVGISHHDQLHTKHEPKTELTEEELKFVQPAATTNKQPKIKGFHFVTGPTVTVDDLTKNFQDLSLNKQAHN